MEGILTGLRTDGACEFPHSGVAEFESILRSVVVWHRNSTDSPFPGAACASASRTLASIPATSAAPLRTSVSCPGASAAPPAMSRDVRSTSTHVRSMPRDVHSAAGEVQGRPQHLHFCARLSPLVSERAATGVELSSKPLFCYRTEPVMEHRRSSFSVTQNLMKECCFPTSTRLI